MKYLFTYEYKGKNNGKAENGSGSCEMTVTGTDKITPKLIQMAVEYVKKDMEQRGFQIDVLAPMGWFKYDEEDEG